MHELFANCEHHAPNFDTLDLTSMHELFANCEHYNPSSNNSDTSLCSV
jgi:hypothetical protein